MAWFASHHHNAAGANEPYAYSYLFAYEIDAPANAKTLTLPTNGKLRILAITVANENPKLDRRKRCTTPWSVRRSSDLHL